MLLLFRDDQSDQYQYDQDQYILDQVQQEPFPKTRLKPKPIGEVKAEKISRREL